MHIQSAGKAIFPCFVVSCFFLSLISFSVRAPRAEAMLLPGIKGLDSPWQVTVAPDGQHLYVASRTEDSVAALDRNGWTGILTLVEVHFDGVAGVDGLNGTTSVAVSPDGAHVYLVGRSDDAMAVFSRDVGTGGLAFVKAYFDGVSGVGGLHAATSVTVSPDGERVYVGAHDSLAVFNRDSTTGKLIFLEVHLEGAGGGEGLGRVESVTVSPDGKHVYVAANSDHSVAVFARDEETGGLSFVEAKFDGVGGVDGLLGATSVTVSPDGAHVYVAGYDEKGLAVFSRDGSNGKLTFVEAKFDGVGGVDGLERPRSVAVSPDGAHVYVAGYADDAVAVFSRDGATGKLTFVHARFAGEPGVYGLSRPTSVTVSPDGAHVYVASRSDDVVTVFSRDDATGSLTLVDDQFGGDLSLSGRRLYIRNAVPEDKEKNGAAWSARDPRVVLPRPGFPGDPRCSYGDGDTATIRFFSDGSAGSTADTGEILLPSENWITVPRSRFKGYKYRDKELDDGPCKVVVVRGERLRARCFGRGATTDLLYDLVEGKDEGIVNVVLSFGLTRYCTAFDDFNGRDGSDGRLFQGKDSPAPLSCPMVESICGDNTVNQPSEECDGTDDSACPGKCIPTGSEGRVCGDNVVNGGNECMCATEQCDGTSEERSECPGSCQADCRCPVPMCNNGVKEEGEQCDPSGSTADCPAGEICGGFCTCVPDVPCACGSPDPTMYLLKNMPPVASSCGTADGSDLTNLECGGLYIGGGSGDLRAPAMLPDNAVATLNIAQCSGTDLTTVPTSLAQVGARHCSEGKKCVGGSNDGESCVRDRDCDSGTCMPRCWFGSYLPILSQDAVNLSVCVSNEIAGDALGAVDCASGRSFTRLSLEGGFYLTLFDQSPSTPGHNPCPVCTGGILDVPNSGVCEGGSNNGQPCMPMSSSYDINHCCAGGVNDSRPCTEDSNCPDSSCVPGCTAYPTSLDCPPHALTKISAVRLPLDLTTERDQAAADASGNFCGWCRNVTTPPKSLCFEGDPDESLPGGAQACPDSAVIACRPATYWIDGGSEGDPADLAECGDAVACRDDLDCTAPYETCEQRSPGAWGDASVRNIGYQGIRTGALATGAAPKAGTVVTAFCIPPAFGVIDYPADLGGPGGLALEVEAWLSPGAGFLDVTTGVVE